MKYKAIAIPLTEESREHQRAINEIKEFCSERGFRCYEGEFGSGRKELKIIVEDSFNSPDMVELIEYCQKVRDPAGERISKRSRNIFDAYEIARQEGSESLRGYRMHLEEEILNRVMKAYSELSKK